MNRKIALELAGKVLRGCAGEPYQVRASPSEFSEAARLVEALAKAADDDGAWEVTDRLDDRLQAAEIRETALIASGFLAALANDPATPESHRRHARMLSSGLAKRAREQA